jgi:DNA polymerase-3 subunit alpha
MTSVLDKTAKLAEYAAECSRLEIKIYPPDINLSDSDFTIERSGDGIRYGLLAIKNVGVGFLKNILFERDTNGNFRSFADFLARMAAYEQLNKRQVEALVKCGVFDSLGVFRSKLLFKYEEIIDSLLSEKKSNIEGQMDFFAFDDEQADDFAVIYPDIPEMEQNEKLAMEKEAAGRFFSGHPLDGYMEAIKRMNSLSIASVLEFFEDDETRENEPEDAERGVVTVVGIIGEVNIRRTKNGDTMAIFTLEDEFSSIEVVAFPKKYAQFIEEIKAGNIIAVQGNISPRDEAPKILLNGVIKLKKNGEPSPPPQDKKTEKAEAVPVLYLKVPDINGVPYKKTVNLIEIFCGNTEVKIYDEETKKIYSLKNPGTDANPVCLNELKNLLGEDNVKIIIKSKTV